jgi:proteasome beta subunit
MQLIYMAFPAYIPGATVVGLAYDNGVILGGEKRISMGNFITNKTGKKVFKINDYVGVGAAGMIADMQALVRQISAHGKILELETGKQLNANSAAKLMSVVMFQRRYFPLMTQIILAGVDDKPSIYVLDPLGSVIPDEYATVGSGAEMAIGVLESQYKPNMNQDDAVALAISSIKAGIARDSASGDGADLLIITKDGIEEKSIAL